MSFLDSSPSFIEETPPPPSRQQQTATATTTSKKNWSEWRTPKSKKDKVRKNEKQEESGGVYSAT